MTTIRLATPEDKQAWDAYVRAHPEGSLFHLSQWRSVIEKSFGHKSSYLIATNPQSLIVGLLPLFHIKSMLFGNYLISIPFAEIGGVLADDGDIKTKLIDQATFMAKEIKCDYLEFRNRTPFEGLLTKDLYVNFKREIFPDPEKNLMAIPRKARRMIRQGDKHGLTFEFGNHQLDEFYFIMCNSYRNLGTPIFSKQFFRNLIDGFGEKSQILIIRTKKGQPAAGVLSFFHNDQVIPYYAGSMFEFRKLAPNDFMYWQLMKYGCEKGYRIFDYGRSKVDTGSFHFKRHWGFEPIPLSYQYVLVRSQELPNLSPANPKYAKKIETWRKLPLSVTKIVGPQIAKYLA